MSVFADSFLAGILCLSAVMAVLWLLQSLGRVRNRNLGLWAERNLMSILTTGTANHKQTALSCRKKQALLNAWITLLQTVVPDDAEKSRFRNLVLACRIDMYWIRRLRARSVFIRSSAAHYLGYLDTDRSKRALATALKQERKESVKLYAIHSLARLGISSALPDIIDTLQGTSDRFIKQITGLLLDFQSSFIALFPDLETRNEPEIRSLILEYARLAPFKDFGTYLMRVFTDPDAEYSMRIKALDCLLESYPYTINPSDYLEDPDTTIARKACAALAARPGKANALILLGKARNPEHREHALQSLSAMVKKSNDVFLFLNDRLGIEKDNEQHSYLCRVLAARLDYYLLHRKEETNATAREIITAVLATGKISDIISFLNSNHDDKLERFVIAAIQSRMYSEAPLAAGITNVSHTGHTPENRYSAKNGNIQQNRK